MNGRAGARGRGGSDPDEDLSADTLERVDRIYVRARRLVDNALAGEYRSVFKGSGTEISDIREYAPGDDVRAIDWNATARSGRPFVSRHVEERELTVILLLDVSASGRFGSATRFKIEAAAELCATVALSAVANNDRVGMILFTDRIERILPARKGRHRARAALRLALAFRPAGLGTDIGRALDCLRRVARRRAVVFLVSDFRAEGYEAALRATGRRHDTIPVVVRDTREAELADAGLLLLEDLETGALRMVDSSSPRVRAAWRARHEAAAAARDRLFRSMDLDTVELSADEPAAPPLMRMFRARARRRAAVA